MIAYADLIAAASDLSEPRQWIAFDEAARSGRWTGPRERVPAALEAVFAACDRDGRVREAAVGRIGCLPVLALRAADWVPQVRARARAECLRVLDESPVAAFLTLAPVAYAVRERGGGDWLAGELDALIRGAAVLPVALTSPNRTVRRVAHLMAIEAELLTLPQLIAAARTDGDTVVRRACGEAAITRGGARALVANGPSGARAYALQVLADLDLAEAALTDRNQIVRATAQVLLRRAGRDPVWVYRALPLSPAVVAGLGETGGADDLATLLPLLGDARVRVRAAATRAVRRLGGTSVEAFLPLLEDPSPLVAREARLGLRDHRVDPDHLAGLIGPGKPVHVRIGAYRLLAAGDVWRWLEAAVTLLADDQLRVRARQDIDSWLIHRAATTYSRPSAALARRVVAMIDTADALDDHRAKVLRFYLMP
ncbi:MAG TPA: hypothetical protein VM677_15120 [Actinokineospora sp.]|jgi:hypothetical protein|nr:hypothetical protein [Actinokineospora sp.]